MNEARDVILKAKFDMLKDENKRLVDLNELLREKFEEADKEIMKVGITMFIIGCFFGAVGMSSVIGWFS